MNYASIFAIKIKFPHDFFFLFSKIPRDFYLLKPQFPPRPGPSIIYHLLSISYLLYPIAPRALSSLHPTKHINAITTIIPKIFFIFYFTFIYSLFFSPSAVSKPIHTPYSRRRRGYTYCRLPISVLILRSK